MTDEPSVENRSNRSVENAAIAYVLEYEDERGRVASDTRGRGAAGDVESDDGRVIEVKAYGRSARGSDLWLETRQVEEARSNPAFHVYVVDNVRQGDPYLFQLIDLHGDILNSLHQRARPQTYVTVPFPVAVYDAVIADTAARQQAEDDKLDWLDDPIPVPDPRLETPGEETTPEARDSS